MQNKNALTRWFFTLISIIIVSLILWNTYSFFNQLKENERNKMEIWAGAQAELSQTLTNEDDRLSEIVLLVLRSNTTTPMVVKTPEDGQYQDRNIDKSKVRDTIAYMEELIERFEKENQPIELSYTDPKTKTEINLGTLYYGNSELLNKLKYYPLALILIICLFFVAIYFFYRTSKSSEQNKLWAGMAKETAHQIGTPLSSLVGWAEILKSEQVNPEYIMEIEKDVARLKTITERFSKVGSKPSLERTDLVAQTRSSVDYLKSRSSKLIDFEISLPDQNIPVLLNTPLYSWTIENIVKNGIDAMKGKGTISVAIQQNSKYVLVHLTDTGKGISKGDQKRIFRPGVTSKKRGWGLGLSLAKRIIEEYHNGKIHVLKSTKDVGTTMEIVLRIDK